MLPSRQVMPLPSCKVASSSCAQPEEAPAAEIELTKVQLISISGQHFDRFQLGHYLSLGQVAVDGAGCAAAASTNMPEEQDRELAASAGIEVIARDHQEASGQFANFTQVSIHFYKSQLYSFLP